MADIAVDHDPFAAAPAEHGGTQVDYNPFAGAAPDPGPVEGLPPQGSAPGRDAIPIPGMAMPPPEPKSGKGFIRKRLEGGVGDLEALGSVLTSIFAGVPSGALAAGNVGIQKIMGKEGPPADQAFAEGMRARTYEPRTEAGKERLGQIGHALEASKIEGLGPTGGAWMGISNAVPGYAAKGAQQGGVVARAMADSKVAQALRKAPGAIGGGIKDFVGDVAGKRVGPAREAASAAAKTEVENAAAALGKSGERDIRRGGALGEAFEPKVAKARDTVSAEAKSSVEKAMLEQSEAGQYDQLLSEGVERTKTEVEAQIKSARGETMDLADQGERLRNRFVDQMTAAEEARKEVADPAYKRIFEIAEEKEASGARANTGAVEESIETLIEKSGGLQDLRGKFSQWLDAIRGEKPSSRAAGVPGGSEFWNPERTGPAAKQAKTDKPKRPKAFEGTSLVAEIKKRGGIDKTDIRDITGEGRVGAGVKGLPPNLFKKEGKSAGTLAKDLAEEGWPIDVSDVDGGVGQLLDMIRQDLDATANKDIYGRVYSSADAERLFRYQYEMRQFLETEDAIAAEVAARAGIPGSGPPPGGEAPGIGPIPDTGPQGRTFQQLEYARRYFNAVANSGDLESYGAIIRGEAGKTAKAIAAAQEEFIPESKVARELYAKMSEPLEALGTKYGKLISQTEGGLKEEAYAKVGAAELPGRILSKKDGIDLLIDALGGGKGANEGMRQYATEQVGEMVGDWIRETTRTGRPTAALEKLSDPKIRVALKSVPDVEQALRIQFGDIAGLDQAAKKMATLATDLGKSGADKISSAEKLSVQIEMADAMAASGPSGKADAIKSYLSSFESARKDGLITQEQYRGVRSLLDRVDNLEQKAKIAQKIAKELVDKGTKKVDAAGVLKREIQVADALAEQKGDAAKKEALTKYTTILDRQFKDGRIPQDRYDAAVADISKARTLEQKTAKARKLLVYLGIGAAGAGGIKALDYLH